MINIWHACTVTVLYLEPKCQHQISGHGLVVLIRTAIRLPPFGS